MALTHCTNVLTISSKVFVDECESWRAGVLAAIFARLPLEARRQERSIFRVRGAVEMHHFLFFSTVGGWFRRQPPVLVPVRCLGHVALKRRGAVPVGPFHGKDGGVIGVLFLVAREGAIDRRQARALHDHKRGEAPFGAPEPALAVSGLLLAAVELPHDAGQNARADVAERLRERARPHQMPVRRQCVDAAILDGGELQNLLLELEQIHRRFPGHGWQQLFVGQPGKGVGIQLGKVQREKFAIAWLSSALLRSPPHFCRTRSHSSASEASTSGCGFSGSVLALLI